MTIKAKKSKINLREKLAELLNFRQIRDRLDGLGLYLGKDRTGTAENLAVRGGANVDDLQLAEISAALGGTAVDVFVYDTRNDSDGGKWRERTQNTSWYNETLGTATRGTRREFPAVAVLVLEGGKLTIYDGDDPDLPMWMVFNTNATEYYLIAGANDHDLRSVAALNGIIVTVNASGYSHGGAIQVNFVKDDGFATSHTDNKRWTGGILNRNSDDYWITWGDGNYIVSNSVNDVAMTVLPNAPIDSETGLPIPTIAVATDGGVSVIKDDGSVISNSDSGTTFVNDVYIDNNYVYASSGKLGFHNPLLRILNYKATNLTEYHRYSSSRGGIDYPLLANGSLNGFPDGWIIDGIGKNKAFGGQATNVDSDSIIGLTLLEEEISNPSLGMVAYTTSSYNTGWMPGDIKLATLSDTKIEKVGVDENTELLVDGSGNWIGDFDVATDVNEWTGAGGTIDGDLGYVKITQTSGATAYLTIPINTIVGKNYKISADIRTHLKGISSTGAAFYIGETAYQNDVALRRPMVSEGDFSNFSLDFVATTSVTHITLASWAAVDDSADFKNVSLKQTGELITNGTFDDGTAGWSSDGATLSVVSGKLRVTNTAANGEAYLGFPTEIGKKYLFTAELTSGTSGAAYYLSNDAPNDYTGNLGFEENVNGVRVKSFMASSAITYIRLENTSSLSGEYSDYDNISVRLAEDDRSVNDNGLQVFGEIDKTPVAPGADLVAYSGFSAENYLMQPYNSDLDFGTGDFCIMGWFKTAGLDQSEYILDRSTDGYPRYLVAIRGRAEPSNPNKLQFAVYNSSNISASVIATEFTVNDNVWTHFCGVFDGSKYRLFVNGVQSSVVAESSGVDTSGDSSPIMVGTRYNSTYPMSGELALLRISATAPTDEQIAKIYRDEKVLFQDGAQATLYGTSDAVTALAYDDKTELLHVGTSGGRSDFSGLRRINNTTIPVTTSISASNNLIAEQ